MHAGHPTLQDPPLGPHHPVPTPAAPSADALREERVLPRHIPALDGIRGIAILLVMILHYETRSWPWRSGAMRPVFTVISSGWLGVDLFFVLSGFLITGILLDARGSDGYFRNFYARRTLRIFPLYYLALLVVFVLLPAAGGAAIGAGSVARGTQLWFWGYLDNVLIALRGWGVSPRMTPHFWTLAVEEQFYLIWPAVVLLCNRRTLMRVCVLAMASALALRIGFRFFGDNELAAYVLMPARFDTLAAGAFVAALLRGPRGVEPFRRWARPLLAVTACGTLAIFAWRHFATDEDRVIATIGLSASAVCFGALLLAAVTAGRSTLRQRILTLPALRFLGRYSYGMYVYHYLVLVALASRGLGVEVLVARFGAPAGHALHLALNAGLTIGISVASWHLFERRFLGLKRYFEYDAPRRAGVAESPLQAVA